MMSEVLMKRSLKGVDEYFLMGRGVVWTGLPLYMEEDVDSSVEWEGYCRLGVESGERLTSDVILLVVQGKGNLGVVL